MVTQAAAPIFFLYMTTVRCDFGREGVPIGLYVSKVVSFVREIWLNTATLFFASWFWFMTSKCGIIFGQELLFFYAAYMEFIAYHFHERLFLSSVIL